MRTILGCLFTVVVLLVGQPAGAGTVKVGMKNGMFVPEVVTVSVGDTVVWLNDDEDTHHRVTFDDPSLISSENLRPNKEYSVTFSRSGEFAYNCRYHKDSGMKGKVVVVDKGK